ncbi:MAG TPA: hypothetical protein DCZ69_02085 [Syntrophobacteraceae bacterium]|nr:hypothetical protein [Syntrophobacteraceae bacterium]HBD07024.1 hypothetical protein [Syntrophobacteraceae bacterium]HBZ56279.1 hypothetical protein [Syntrophobacteraceae bacterium]
MEAFDRLRMRCPRLGGEVTLSYCECEAGELPCWRILHCWQAFLPIDRYLRWKLTQEQWDRCFSQAPKTKVTSLLELVEAARSQGEKDV